MTTRVARYAVLSERRKAVWQTAARHGCFAMLPLGLTAYVWWFAAVHHSFAVDFNHAFWPAGRMVLDGNSPYVATSSALIKQGVAFEKRTPCHRKRGWRPRNAPPCRLRRPLCHRERQLRHTDAMARGAAAMLRHVLAHDVRVIRGQTTHLVAQLRWHATRLVPRP